MESEILYKFRDWNAEFGKDLIKNQNIYFSSFSNFNDPFDSDIQLNYRDLTAEEIDQIAARHVDHDYPNLSKFRRRIMIEKFKSESALGNMHELEKNYEEVVRPANESEMGIFSLSKTKENILLWSHYTNSHKGYCVGIDAEYLNGLADHFLLQEDLLTVFEEVTYKEEYPNINPASDDPKIQIYPLQIKSTDWEYEQEVRFIIKGIVNETVKIDSKAIREVILGLKMSDENRDEILEAIRIQIPHAEVYQAKKAERRFALEFEKVQL